MRLRHKVQLASTLLHNAHIKGFATFSIYQGAGKKLCVPVLNCYSCPGALGSCPIGSMQFMLASAQHQFSFYVAGVLTMVGAAAGRFACGWLCPFGMIQEWLGRLSSYKKGIPRVLTYIKYIILIFTLLLPVWWLNAAGVGSPYFCQYLCPAGTLEGGLLLGVAQPELRSMMGGLFAWKLGVLLFFLLAAIITYRPFCRVLCPLGAIYALFNRVSLWRLEVHQDNCISCGRCQQSCPVDIKVYTQPNSPECIRCLQCIDECPQNALHFSIRSYSMTAGDQQC
ncbi:MAG TPA: 4Fe-4S binding protein [Syntrophomonadaceae bacterium]|nr:4Fe-4S binding protein [Syntrophomonadaceae bacterium]